MLKTGRYAWCAETNWPISEIGNFGHARYSAQYYAWREKPIDPSLRSIWNWDADVWLFCCINQKAPQCVVSSASAAPWASASATPWANHELVMIIEVFVVMQQNWEIWVFNEMHHFSINLLPQHFFWELLAHYCWRLWSKFGIVLSTKHLFLFLSPRQFS